LGRLGRGQALFKATDAHARAARVGRFVGSFVGVMVSAFGGYGGSRVGLGRFGGW